MLVHQRVLLMNLLIGKSWPKFEIEASKTLALCLEVWTDHLLRPISASQQSSTAQSLPTQFFRWIPILFFLSWIPRNGNRFSKPIKKKPTPPHSHLSQRWPGRWWQMILWGSWDFADIRRLHRHLVFHFVPTLGQLPSRSWPFASTASRW